MQFDLKREQAARRDTQSNTAAALSLSECAATMRCIMSMNAVCSRSLKLSSVARCAARAEASILASSAAPAGVIVDGYFDKIARS